MTNSFSGKIFRLNFPVTNGQNIKKRPALALSEPDQHGDIRWAFITTKQYPSLDQIEIQPSDLSEGTLPRTSFLAPDKIFTINKDRIDRYYASTSTAFQARLAKHFVLRETRTFSRLTHTNNRPGDDPIRLAQNHSHPHHIETIPYAGRVFTEDEVEAAVSATLDFWLTLGTEGEAFEKELATFLGVKHSLLVNSGSSANLVAISALTTHKLPPHKRIQTGDEVITVAAGFPTTVAPIVQVGAIPVFIDADPVTGNADCSQLEAAYSPGKTKAVMMAHALGNPFDLAATLAFCKKYDLWLIEDNCDALGCTYSLPVELAQKLGLDHLLKIATNLDDTRRTQPTTHPPIPNIQNGILTAYTGTFGDLSTQSFYPPHHLTMGEGGAVNIIRRPPLKTYAESFRDWGRDCWCPSGKDNTCGKRFGWQLGQLPHGYDHKYIYSHLGFNLKPLDPQAAIGRVQLKRLPAFIEARKRNWETLRQGLAHLEKYIEFALPTHATAWTPQPTSPTSPISNFSWDSTGCQTGCSWFGFKMTIKPTAPFSRTDLARHLDENKIGNRMLFGGNLVRQPAFVQLIQDRPNAFRIVPSTTSSKNSSPLPGADQIMENTIFLGTYPGLTTSQLQRMIQVISNFAASKEKTQALITTLTPS